MLINSGAPPVVGRVTALFRGIWANTPMVTDWSQNRNGCTHEDAAQEFWGLVGGGRTKNAFPRVRTQGVEQLGIWRQKISQALTSPGAVQGSGGNDVVGMFVCIGRLLWDLWDVMGGSGVQGCLPGLGLSNQEANTDLFSGSLGQGSMGSNVVGMVVPVQKSHYCH